MAITSSMPLSLRGQHDAHDRRIYILDWLLHTTDVYRQLPTDDESEQQYKATPDIVAQRCYINQSSTRRLIPATGQVMTFDVEVLFEPYFQLAENDILRSGKSLNGTLFYGEVRVSAVDVIHHPEKNVHTLIALCVKH